MKEKSSSDLLPPPSRFHTTSVTAVAFALGGASGGGIWVWLDNPLAGFALLGACGALGVAGVTDANRSWRRLLRLSLAGALGYTFGFMLSFFVVLTLWEPSLSGLFIGAVGGAVGGLTLGWALRLGRQALLVALASAVGFGLAGELTAGLLTEFSPQWLGGSLTLAIWGASGGAAIGALLGVLKRRSHNG